MSEPAIKLRLSDAAATQTLGDVIAAAMPVQVHDAAVVYLRGELGAGKTTCARSLLRALGVQGVVRSPTYTLVELYEGNRVRGVHIDLYRLLGPRDLDDLGLRDYLGGGHLILIEWPERGGPGLPCADLELQLTYAGEDQADKSGPHGDLGAAAEVPDGGRFAALHARSELGTEWLKNLRNDARLAPYVVNLT